ncbi:MAG TPA: bifunctional folylpolyglutamate synthase/dihydrofolate synthase, partial [Treponema sp.]|nr:bifunctional folylpolyglutamate synthase/dihydrofolate synthase [Treponema sp.]
MFEKWLDSFLNFEKLPQKNMFWLDTMQFMCKRLGNPQELHPSFHVGGSKGKGSTSTMIASILDQAQYSVGLYTSPHILSLKERVTSAKGFFSDAVY